MLSCRMKDWRYKCKMAGSLCRVYHCDEAIELIVRITRVLFHETKLAITAGNLRGADHSHREWGGTAQKERSSPTSLLLTLVTSLMATVLIVIVFLVTVAILAFIACLNAVTGGH